MKFFLGSLFFSCFALAFTVFWLFNFHFFFSVTLIIFLVLIFIFRKLPPAFQEDSELKSGILFSPVNGKVLSVTEGVEHPILGSNFKEVVIVSSWLREQGVYFPTRSEVIDINYTPNKGHFRYSMKNFFNKGKERIPSLSILLRSIDAANYGIDFYKCPTGMWPKVRVIPGDRGKAQVNLGFFGLGGTTAMYIPSQYNICVKEGLDLIAGQSILANQL